MKCAPALLSVVLGVGSLMVGCASERTRSADPPPPPPRSSGAPTAAPVAPPAASPPTEVAPSPEIDTTQAPIGVQPCDDYLNSYRACHSVIGMLDSEMVESRYKELRASWERQARSNLPADRERLERQCINLQETMNEALNGRDCAPQESEFIEADEN